MLLNLRSLALSLMCNIKAPIILCLYIPLALENTPLRVRKFLRRARRQGAVIACYCKAWQQCYSRKGACYKWDILGCERYIKSDILVRKKLPGKGRSH